MPIYEYICTDCGLKFELLRPMSQLDEAAICPGCHNGAQRILSAFASFSRDAGGELTSLGSSMCSSCSATSCDTCQ